MSENTTQSDSTTFRPLGDDSVGYDPTTETFHARFDDDTSTVVVAIVETVAAATNRDPIAMPPLYASVDPEALTALVTSPRGGPVDVTFSYEGCHVTVSSLGTVVVEQRAN